MKASTADPALTSIMTRRGFFSLPTISLILRAPITLVPERQKERERGRDEDNKWRETAKGIKKPSRNGRGMDKLQEERQARNEK